MRVDRHHSGAVDGPSGMMRGREDSQSIQWHT